MPDNESFFRQQTFPLVHGLSFGEGPKKSGPSRFCFSARYGFSDQPAYCPWLSKGFMGLTRQEKNPFTPPVFSVPNEFFVKDKASVNR
jgi:hypothetical protein